MFITPEIAKVHLRDPSADAADLALKSAAAELSAVSYLDRAVFADQTTLDAAVALVPAALIAAKAAFSAADAAADLIADVDIRLIEKAYALETYSSAVFSAARTRRGILINAAIQSAMLLTLGHLWENREDASIPYGAQCLLDAYRNYSA